jgi:hypothetical protein
VSSREEDKTGQYLATANSLFIISNNANRSTILAGMYETTYHSSLLQRMHQCSALKTLMACAPVPFLLYYSMKSDSFYCGRICGTFLSGVDFGGSGDSSHNQIYRERAHSLNHFS